MARVPAWAVGKIVWADKTLQAAQFADDANPHVNPVAGDIDLNSLIADYVSETDSNSQTIASVLGLGASPPSGYVLLVQDTALGNPIPITNPTVLFLGNATANKLGVANSTYIYLGATGALDVNGQTNPNVTGLNFVPVITNTGSAVTMGNFTGLKVFPKTTGFGANTITQLAGIEIQLVHLVSNPTVTTAYGIKLGNMGKSTYATIYGIDIGTLTGTTKIGIREQSGGVNLLSSKTRFGDQTTPTETLEALGNILATTNLKQSTSPGSPVSTGPANLPGNSPLVPALDHVHQTRLQVEDQSGGVVSSQSTIQFLASNGAQVTVQDDSVNGRAIVQIGLGQIGPYAIQTVLTSSGPIMFPYLPPGKSVDLYVPLSGATLGMSVSAIPVYNVEKGLFWNTFISTSNLVTLRVKNEGPRPVSAGNRVWRIDLKP